MAAAVAVGAFVAVGALAAVVCTAVVVAKHVHTRTMQTVGNHGRFVPEVSTRRTG